MIEGFIDDIFQDRRLYGNSSDWANWMSQLSITTCKYCVDHHGKIVDISIMEYKPEVDAHERCRCIYVPVRTKKAGTATNMGYNGADAQLFYFNRLPEYYVSKKQARISGWRDWMGNLDDVLPGAMIGGDVYKNKDGKLPIAPQRAWYEADINYDGGYRNRQRVLYSNDGLIFVTYDHFQTFHQITG